MKSSAGNQIKLDLSIQKELNVEFFAPRKKCWN